MFGFHKDPTSKLRKKYDRAREKADKLKDRSRKMHILRMLDQIEPTLISLEEQEQPKFERKRMVSYIRDNVEAAEDMLKDKFSENNRGEYRDDRRESREDGRNPGDEGRRSDDEGRWSRDSRR